MSYIQDIQSDASGTVAFSPGTIDTSTKVTDAIDVRSYSDIDFVIFLTSAGAISKVDFTIEFSDLASPSGLVASADWAAVRIDNIDLTTGISELKSYAPREAITGPATFPISSPTRGRWMRLKFTATGGSGTASINAYRRA